MVGILAGPGAEEERFAGGFDDFGGDGVELVDVADAPDPDEEALDEAEIAVGDAGDGGDRFGGGEVIGTLVREKAPSRTHHRRSAGAHHEKRCVSQVRWQPWVI